MARVPNVVVAQSGGPSAVINNSLRGIIETCRDHPNIFGKVLAGWHGIEGVLKEELLDLSAQSAQEVALLSVTPAAGSIGSCRYKLKEDHPEDFARVIEVLKAHDVGYFFYIGGNDSQHTAFVVSQLAREQGLDLVATGVPKTIDNDVGDTEFKLIDHTPGYGSTARYYAQYIRNLEEENRGSSPADPVMVLQAMGRKIGYIPAAARLADPGREMPLLIILAEAELTIKDVYDAVCEQLGRSGRAIVVISEGFKMSDEELGITRDAFGHASFGASKSSVAQLLTNYLNEHGLPVPGAARFQIPGTDQRNAIIYASTVDLDEAYKVGQKAVEIARTEGNGWMATILREPGAIYNVRYDKVPLERVALVDRQFPKTWIAGSRTDVTDDFVAYARPLIGNDWPSIPLVDGLQRFARFQPIFADKQCPAYVPRGYRG